MLLKKLNPDDVVLVAPFQCDGKFDKYTSVDFWQKVKGTYKVYLLREDYIDCPKEAGNALFWIDTGATVCMFRGYFK